MTTKEALRELDSLSKWLGPVQKLKDVFDLVQVKEEELKSIDSKIDVARERSLRMESEVQKLRDERVKALSELGDKLEADKTKMKDEYTKFRDLAESQKTALNNGLQQLKVDYELAKKNYLEELKPLEKKVAEARKTLDDFNTQLAENIKKAVASVKN